MRLRTAMAIAGLGVAGAQAAGQRAERMEFTITLRDIGNGNGVVEPGEAVRLWVTATMDPGPGGPAQWNNFPGANGAFGTVYAFNGAIFDVMGVQNSGTGAMTFGSPGPIYHHGQGILIPATQSVPNWSPAQFVWLPLIPGVTSNPVDLFAGIWTPNDYTPRELEYEVSGIELASVYLQVPGYAQPVPEYTVNAGSRAVIPIVPEPGAAVCAGIMLWRRRR